MQASSGLPCFFGNGQEFVHTCTNWLSEAAIANVVYPTLTSKGLSMELKFLQNYLVYPFIPDTYIPNLLIRILALMAY